MIELREKLPRGSALIIKARLSKKGLKYTLQYIYRCLDPYQEDYNRIIIKEAILLGEELTRNLIDDEGRISQLRKPDDENIL